MSKSLQSQESGARRSSFVVPAIIAAVMLWYAYPLSEWTLPTENPARIGSQIFLYSLAVGGWLLAGTAIVLLIGLRAGEVFDAGFSMLIGSGIGVGGVLQGVGGSSMGWVYLLFGVMFVGTGWSNLQELSARRRERTTPATPSSNAPPAARALRPPDPPPSLPPHPPAGGPQTKPAPPTPETTARPAENAAAKPVPEGPAEGFLARFADSPRNESE